MCEPCLGQRLSLSAEVDGEGESTGEADAPKRSKKRIRLWIIAIDCAWFTSICVAVAPAMMVLALTCEQDDRGVRASGAGL